MQIMIEAKNAADLRAKIIDLNEVFGIQKVLEGQNMNTMRQAGKAAIKAVTTEDKGSSVEDTQMSFPEEKKGDSIPDTTPEDPVKEAKNRVKKKKDEVETPKGKYTKDDARKALEKVNENHGIEVAREILTHFSCKRLSELPETDYPLFIHKCAMAGK